MPAPYGAIAAAGFDLVSLFVSPGTTSTEVILKELESVKTQLEEYIAQVAFDKDFADISICAGAVKDQLNIMQAMNWQAFPNPGWVALLQDNTQPGASCAYTATGQIWELWLTTTEQLGALDAWVAGESVVLMCMKLQIQTAATLEAQARAKLDWQGVYDQQVAWWTFYNIFKQEVEEKSAAVLAWIIDQIDDRFVRVSGVHDDFDHMLDRGETFTDTGAGDDPQETHFLASGGSDFPGPDYAPVADTHSLAGATISPVTANYHAYMGALGTDLDRCYAGATSAVNAWTAAAQTWQIALPPIAPDKAPAVKMEPGDGTPWPAGSEVKYSYALGNSRGVATPSLTDDPHGMPTNWTMPQPPPAGCYPTLTFDTATDAELGGVTRYLYRTLYQGTPLATTLQCIAAMPVAQATFTDDFVHPPSG
ncbi:hypothetical protein CJ178_30155 [Rhodococcus sp. ACPA4]|uniref:hypothetical protein n=1 Tax=Rhodococcus sp. ACPA4 TaxID=2028571 RepID=UPI000BB10B60|nr:hypothetical protein [Rhodococcus sp. ACPA4]PBC35741.1 hypothetical protein CJ178_30155 [Rhodococcus sp. ACPA4]